MNPIGKVTRAVTHPVRTAGSVAGQALGLAAAGARTTARVMDWTASHVPGSDDGTAPVPAPREDTGVATPRPAALTAEAQDSDPSTPPPAARVKATGAKNAKKKAPRKAPANKAPSARAATAGPALAAGAKEAGEDPSEVLSAVTSTEDSTSAQAGDSSEPLLDLSVAKAIRNESEVLQKAADPHKG
ncbi:MAG: hypothetical protein JWN68_1269 [Nocardioides sp.]|jgi:hypothetical protein|uniref:hypothetical protein n=1 Tax=Nocardioides sp. TaxID=35761 RepID=UPI002619F058|nr:hypothetical protein [Nocardioides sp.]MCW2833316.1 hypothetical protein [Nocardioides sp.]